MPTSLIGHSQIPAQNFRRLLALNGGPDGVAKGQVVEIYYAKENEGEWGGIRADVAVAQMLHETDYLRSWWSQPPRRNLAGIGVTGLTQHLYKPKNSVEFWAYKQENGTWYEGCSFDNFWEAVDAHLAHLSAYIWPTSQPINGAEKKDSRYAVAKLAFTENRWSPCRMLSDLNGRWAVPGTNYGQMIEGIMSAARGS